MSWRRKGCGWLLAAVAALGVLPVAATAHESLQRQIAALGVAIAAAPTQPDRYLQRGELYRLHGDWAAAEADFRRAATLDPGTAELGFRLGRLWFDAGRDAQAGDTLSRFVAAHPDHRAAWIVLARTLSRRGDDAAAADAFGRGISADSAPQLLLDHARALARAGRHDAALAGLDAALAQRGPLIVLELEAIELELARLNFDAAIRRLDRIAARMPRSESWLARRGDVLSAAGRLDEARAAYTAALAAIEALPATKQSTGAVRDLHEAVTGALRRLDAQPVADRG